MASKVAFVVLTGLLVQASSHAVPHATQCQPNAIPQSPTNIPIIIDNGVANALANALQIMIVSNLIESTLNCPREVEPKPICGKLVNAAEVFNNEYKADSLWYPEQNPASRYPCLDDWYQESPPDYYHPHRPEYPNNQECPTHPEYSAYYEGFCLNQDQVRKPFASLDKV